MGKGVFIHRTDSRYDDAPATRYHIPSNYLRRANELVGDWIVYLEPSKVARSRGYYAIARVAKIIRDDDADSMYLAVIEPGSYLEFAEHVPFKGVEGVIERGVLNPWGRVSGRAQAAVRALSENDYDRIVTAGLDRGSLLPRLDAAPISGFQEEQAPYESEDRRERMEHLVSRPVRDRVFRQIVLRAYGERCAVTGLKLINGGGRAEAEAAHIQPVEADGPDMVSNGLALSGTAHWMFDRGLISLTDDLNILISRQANDAAGIKALINRSGRAHPPVDSRDRPHPQFLKWHRETCFKQ